MSDDLQARLEQALADNAALLDLIRRFRTLPEPLDDDGSTATWARAYMDVERGMDAALRQSHPGSSMRRELLVLRRVRDAATRILPFLPRLDSGPVRLSEHAQAAGALRDACAEADAAREI